MMEELEWNWGGKGCSFCLEKVKGNFISYVYFWLTFQSRFEREGSCGRCYLEEVLGSCYVSLLSPLQVIFRDSFQKWRRRSWSWAQLQAFRFPSEGSSRGRSTCLVSFPRYSLVSSSGRWVRLDLPSSSTKSLFLLFYCLLTGLLESFWGAYRRVGLDKIRPITCIR